MVTLKIDNINVTCNENATILEAARSVGIRIPTLCYLKEINEIGACRVCVVEVEGSSALRASCNTKVADGMVVRTNTAAVRQARKDIVSMILSRHDAHCPTCPRSGNCMLQELAADLGIRKLPYETRLPRGTWDESFPLIREEAKCIGCLRCAAVCDKVQGLGVWDLIGTGSRARVGLANADYITAADCALCGQCITHCPVGALYERDDTEQVFEAIENAEKRTVVQIAPAVRAAWAEELGLSDTEATVGRMVAAAKALGFDYVLDTGYTADLTIMEEGSEFLERFTHRDEYAWPMFTSCCPGWVRFVKSQYPEFVGNLSSAKSPQQMFGAVIKSYFAKKIEADPASLYSVSIMPCTAKKYEAGVPALSDAGAGQDVDTVLTTREFVRMIRAAHINVAQLPEMEFDSPLGYGSGAGVIFGATGGVMEAALRTAYNLLTKENPAPDAFRQLRIEEGYQLFTMSMAGQEIKVAVSSGLGNARKLLDDIKAGKVQADFVEIMACPGGCAGGGGQPIACNQELAAQRGEKLHALDANASIRFSHENPDVIATYAEYFGSPLSETSHHLLHTKHAEW